METRLYEMRCFKREMSSTPKDSKAWWSIKLVNRITITLTGIQDKNTKNTIKSKNYPKNNTLREPEKLDVD